MGVAGWYGIRVTWVPQRFVISVHADHRAQRLRVHPQPGAQCLAVLYREVLREAAVVLTMYSVPMRPRRIPSVLTVAEVASLLGTMTGIELLLANLLYGTGMRLNEGLRLRVKDMDFDQRVLVVAATVKAEKDRVVIFAAIAGCRVALANGAAVTRTGELDRQQQRRVLRCPMHWRPNTPVWASAGIVLGVSISQLSIDPRSRIERRHLVTRNVCSAPSSWLLQQRSSQTCFRFTPYVIHLPHLLQAGTDILHRCRVAGSLGCQHHHDLHPRAQGGGGRHSQPAGCTP